MQLLYGLVVCSAAIRPSVWAGRRGCLHQFSAYCKVLFTTSITSESDLSSPQPFDSCALDLGMKVKSWMLPGFSKMMCKSRGSGAALSAPRSPEQFDEQGTIQLAKISCLFATLPWEFGQETSWRERCKRGAAHGHKPFPAQLEKGWL